MRVNGHEITAEEFAFDECHKIYLINSTADREKLLGYGYELFPIEDLEYAYNSSCGLRFIEDAEDFKEIVPQFATAVFN